MTTDETPRAGHVFVVSAYVHAGGRVRKSWCEIFRSRKNAEEFLDDIREAAGDSGGLYPPEADCVQELPLRDALAAVNRRRERVRRAWEEIDEEEEENMEE